MMRYRPRHPLLCEATLFATLAISLSTSVAQAVELKLYTRTDFNAYVRNDDSLLTQLGDNDAIQALQEVNVDLGRTFFEMLRLYTDTSLLYLVQAKHPRLRINEVRAELAPHENFSFWLGKRRVDHSVGYAFSPTNVLSPAKNASEPMLEREGRWGAGFALPFDTATFTFTWALHHSASDYGTPSSFDVERSAFLGAVYLNLWRSDINFIYANIEQQHTGGFNFSRYLINSVELHLDLLLQQGRTVPELGGGAQSAASAPSLAADGVYLRAAGGLRYEFLQTKGLATVEYYFNGAGLSASELEQTYATFDRMAAMRQSADLSATGSPLPIEDLFGDGLPGRHHMMLFFQYRELFDYWTTSLSCIWSMEDNSFQFYPKVGYKLNDIVLIETGVVVPVGGSSSEFGMLPRALTHLVRIWVYI